MLNNPTDEELEIHANKNKQNLKSFQTLLASMAGQPGGFRRV
jgi:hypothetical protein